MFLLVLCVRPAFAATATATVTAEIPALTLISLDRDTNSVIRGSADEIIFDKLDSDDKTDGSAGFMYAPYRSEADEGKNWHIAKIIANGSTMTLGMSVTGYAGSMPLSSILRVWCGGFFLPGSNTPIEGTATPQEPGWEYAEGWQRDLSQPFTGTVPFSYQLNVSQVGAGSHSGSIMLTLTTT